MHVDALENPAPDHDDLCGTRGRRRWFIPAEGRARHGRDGRARLGRRRGAWSAEVKRFPGPVEPGFDVRPEKIDGTRDGQSAEERQAEQSGIEMPASNCREVEPGLARVARRRFRCHALLRIPGVPTAQRCAALPGRSRPPAIGNSARQRNTACRTCSFGSAADANTSLWSWARVEHGTRGWQWPKTATLLSRISSRVAVSSELPA